MTATSPPYARVAAITLMQTNDFENTFETLDPSKTQGRGATIHFLSNIPKMSRNGKKKNFLHGRGYLPEPVPANENLFAGTCSGK